MKTLALGKMGLNELSLHEQNELNGGFWQYVVAGAVAAIGAIATYVSTRSGGTTCTTTSSSCIDENGCTISQSTTVCVNN